MADAQPAAIRAGCYTLFLAAILIGVEIGIGIDTVFEGSATHVRSARSIEVSMALAITITPTFPG